MNKIIKIHLFEDKQNNNIILSYLKNRKEAYSHKSKKNLEWFNWKFFNSPNGESIMAVASINNRIAGSNSYGVYLFKQGNKKIKAIMPYDAFVHKDFQNRGIFKKLIKAIEENAKKKGVQLLVAFPNSNSLQGFRRMNWIYKNNFISYWIKPSFNSKFLLYFFDLKKGFKPNEPEGSNKFNFSDVSYTIYGDELHGYWSLDYLNWRFCELPQAEYIFVKDDLIEYVLRIGFRGRFKEAQILYLNTKKSQVERKDFEVLKIKLQKEIKIDLLSFPMSKDHPLNKKMYKIGFFNVKSKTNFVYKILDPNLEENFKFSLCGLEFHTY